MVLLGGTIKIIYKKGFSFILINKANGQSGKAET